MIRYKTSCLKCNLEVQNRYFEAHKCKPKGALECTFCGRVSNNLNSATQHLVRCKNNPNQIDLSHLKNGANFKSYVDRIKKGEIVPANQYTKASRLGLPKPSISTELLEKLKEANRNRVWDEAARQKHSLSMKIAVENNPESYTSSNRGRTKQIIYKGKKFQGNWELKFYKWCEANHILCERNSAGFSYEWNGKRTYYPDFYLPDYDAYVEVKGYKTDRDSAKWNQFPHKLLVIEKQAIFRIERDIYQLDF